MLAAGDTFRAAAIAQLQTWGDRAGVPVISGKEGADAAGPAFDAHQRSRSEGVDVLIVDTARSLQNKQGMMDELANVKRVLGKLDAAAPHDVRSEEHTSELPSLQRNTQGVFRFEKK